MAPILFMPQFLSQEISQELDCKDNQNDNDGCQDSHIVIVAVNTQGKSKSKLGS